MTGMSIDLGHVPIIKADGTEEPFDLEKLITSLKRSGASDEAITEVTREISTAMRPGMTTGDIYRRVYAVLKRSERQPVASRYSLKRALLDLGPTGYPFEDYVAQIWSALGWKTQTRLILSGRCTTHEVDMVAEKGGRKIAAEVKFHNAPGMRSDVKTALYVNARWHDINARLEASGEKRFDEWLLITNTHFTSQAEEYGGCAGLSLISWNYPHHGNLQDLIEETRVHPLTCLTTISRYDKNQLLKDGVVLCRTVAEDPGQLRRIGVPEPKVKKIIAESKYLCTP